MKRIFTLSLIALAAFTIASCSKNDGYYGGGGGFDENYWLSKERGEVVYSDAYCSYYVVETYYGYNIIRAYGGYMPFEGNVVYGNFSTRGTRDFYNRSTGRLFTGTVTDYWLTYSEAQDALDYYCPLKAGAARREFKTATQIDNK